MLSIFKSFRIKFKIVFIQAQVFENDKKCLFGNNSFRDQQIKYLI
jgi:hypothetical protein